MQGGQLQTAWRRLGHGSTYDEPMSSKELPGDGRIGGREGRGGSSQNREASGGRCWPHSMQKLFSLLAFGGRVRIRQLGRWKLASRLPLETARGRCITARTSTVKASPYDCRGDPAHSWGHLCAAAAFRVQVLIKAKVRTFAHLFEWLAKMRPFREKQKTSP